MLWTRLVSFYKQIAHQPWQCWGGCTDPGLSRYAMDYALGWLDHPEAVPELAERAAELRAAFAAHLPQCRRCQEQVHFWQTSEKVAQDPARHLELIDR